LPLVSKVCEPVPLNRQSPTPRLAPPVDSSSTSMPTGETSRTVPPTSRILLNFGESPPRTAPSKASTQPSPRTEVGLDWVQVARLRRVELEAERLRRAMLGPESGARVTLP
jgi:hypothetical protein